MGCGQPQTLHGFEPVFEQEEICGFGVWLNDILYNAWMWGFFDVNRALENLMPSAHQTEAGNFPALVTGNDASLDRTQPPIAAFVVWSLYEKTGHKDILEKVCCGSSTGTWTGGGPKDN